MMYNTLRALALPIIAATALFSASMSPSHAQATVQVTFNSSAATTEYLTSSDPTLNNENAYVGGYEVDINGNTADPVSVFCTTINNDVSPNETWNAFNVQTTEGGYSSAPNSNTLIAGDHYNGGYNPSSGPNATTIRELDYITASYVNGTATQSFNAQLAIWDLLANAGAATGTSGTGWGGNFSASGGASITYANVLSIETAAISAAAGPDISFGSDWLLAKIPATNVNPAQDFTYDNSLFAPPVGPEPASLAVFGFVAFGIAALALRRRGRIAQLTAV